MSGYRLRQSQINVIGGLTRFIDDFNKEDFGSIEITTKDSSPSSFFKREYSIPEASYSESVRKFIITCKNVLKNYPEYGNQRYKYSDLKPSVYTRTPADKIINRIFAVLDAESYCDGPLMKYLQRGTITSWLGALRMKLSNIVTGSAMHDPSPYGVDDPFNHFEFVEAVAEEEIFRESLKYTVEPADEECRHLNKDKYTTWKNDIGGGIGMRFQSMKLHDYGRSDYPALSDFLDQLVYVEPTKKLSPEQRRRLYGGNKTGAYPSYYSNDLAGIRAFLVKYIEAFASGASDDVLATIDNYHRAFDADYYGKNIVLHEDYFEEIFRRSSLIVANYLFEETLLNSVNIDTGRDGFIGAFERLCRIELFFVDLPGLFHFDDYSFYGFHTKEKCFVCNRMDYYRSIKPFALFLSNYRLILSAYMAIKRYGQCHFSICWETDTGEDMAPEEWPHPNRG